MKTKMGRTPDESRARQGVELIAIRWTRFPNRRVAGRPAVEFIHEIVTPDGPAVRRVSATRAYKWATVTYFTTARKAQHSATGACIYAAHDAGELCEVNWTTKEFRPVKAVAAHLSAERLPVCDLHEMATEFDRSLGLSVEGIRSYVRYRRDQLAGPTEVKPCRS